MHVATCERVLRREARSAMACTSILTSSIFARADAHESQIKASPRAGASQGMDRPVVLHGSMNCVRPFLFPDRTVSPNPRYSIQECRYLPDHPTRVFKDVAAAQGTSCHHAGTHPSCMSEVASGSVQADPSASVQRAPAPASCRGMRSRGRGHGH